MKIMKKIVGLLLAASMLPVTISASAATVYEGDMLLLPETWSIGYTKTKSMTDFVSLIEGEGRNGSNGLFATTTESANYIQVVQKFNTELKNGDTYRFGMWRKGSGREHKTLLDWNDNYKVWSSDTAKFKVGETDGDWTYYYMDFALSADKGAIPTELRLIFDGGRALNYVFDDMTFKKLDTATGQVTGDNLIANGDFEIAKPQTVDADVEDLGAYTSMSWKTYYNQNEANMPRNVYYAQPTKEYARSGDYGMLINFGGLKSSNRYFYIKNSGAPVMKSGNTYTLEFWLKGDIVEPYYIRLGDLWDYEARLSTCTKNETDANGWTRYTASLKLNDGVESFTMSEFWVMLEQRAQVVIDDMRFYNNAQPDVNLLADGGFENNAAVAEQKYKLNGFNMHYSGISDAEKNITHYIEPTAKETHGGDYSMHIVYNGGAAQDKYVRSYINKAYPADSYKISFYMKGDARIFLGITWDAAQGYLATGGNTYVTLDVSEADADGWKKYSADIPTTGDNTYFHFMANNMANVYIDDVVITDSKGVNVLPEGTFENVSELNPIAENKYNFDGFTTFKAGITSEQWANTYFVEPSVKNVHSGSYSAHLVYPQAKTNNTYAALSVVKKFEAGNYTMSFYTKGAAEDVRIGLVKEGDWTMAVGGGYGAINDGFFDIADVDEKGWTKWSKNITLANEEESFMILANANVDIYIDDITIINAEGVNVLPEGTFENVGIIDYVSVKNLLAYPVNAGGGLNISWTNPNNNGIEGYRLYVGGKEYAVDADISANAFNQVLVEGLENNNEYEVKLVEIIGGEETDYVTVGIPDSQGGGKIYFSNWYFERMNKEEAGAYSNAVPSIDTEEKASGNSSFRVDLNLPSVVGNLYPNLGQHMTLRRDTPYTLKFKLKAEGITRFFVIGEFSAKDEEGNSHSSWFPVRFDRFSGSWEEKTVSFETMGCTAHENCTYKFFDENDMDTEYTGRIMLHSDCGTGSYWIDDVVMYEPGFSDLSATDIIKDGGFELGLEIKEPEFELAIEGEEPVKITKLEKGSIDVTAKVKNFTMGSNKNVFVAVALYDGTKLEDVTVMEQKLSPSSVIIPADEFTANINVPALTGHDYKIKIMYWNGLDTMSAIGEADILAP